MHYLYVVLFYITFMEKYKKNLEENFKKVTAIMNVINYRLHKYPDLNENEMKLKVNLKTLKYSDSLKFLNILIKN